MLPLQHILSQLGYAIICSIWQMGLLWIFYIIVTAFGNPSPNNRFRLSLLLSVLGTLWFLITIISGLPSKSLIQSNIFSNEAFAVSPQFLMGDWLLYAMGCAYLIFLLYTGIKSQIPWKIRTLNSYENNSSKAPVTLRLFVEKKAALLGIHRRILLKISDVFSPSTYGFFKPVILLPVSCLTQLNTQQIEALLLHELAHIRRNDFFCSLVLQVVEMVMYFNPFMHWLVADARKECEHACDDLVIQFGYVPKDYARALLDVAKHGYATGWALQASGTHQRLLLNRIARMLGQASHQKKYSGKSILLTGACIFSFAFSVIISNKMKVEMKEETINTATLENSLQEDLNTNNVSAWQQNLVDTRKQIIKLGIDKTNAKKEKRKAAIDQAASEIEFAKSLKQKEAVQQFIENNQADNTEAEPAVSQLILSAGWAEQMGNPEAGISAMEKGWKALSALIEKLETEKVLQESEWEQLATLITFHSNIRDMIYRETRKSQFGVMNSSVVNETNDGSEKDVLVIVYDEGSGALAASLMPGSALKLELNLPDLREDKQKVIILRKWLDKNRKVISL